MLSLLPVSCCKKVTAVRRSREYRDARGTLPGHFKVEVKSRDFVSRVIVGIRELRDPIQKLRFLRRPLIDPRKKIDQVCTRRACRRESDDDVALAVEAAGITHVGVVVCSGIYVVVLRPADALEMNRDRCACRTGGRNHADDARLYREIRTRNGRFAVPQFDAVTSAQVLRNGYRKCDRAIGSNLYFPDLLFLWGESVAADPAAGVGLPINIQHRIGRETLARQYRGCTHGAL